MKVALVWNHPSRLLDCSFRFEQYLAGFRALGHDPVVVCDQSLVEGFDGPIEPAKTSAELAEPAFWRRVAADVAVVVTWHRMASVLSAIGTAGTHVIAIADTDGRLSLRTYPAAALERLMVYQDSFTDRLKCFKYWLGRRLNATTHGPSEDQEALASTRASDALIFGHARGAQHFSRFLARYGEQMLSKRIATVPFAIGASFLTCPIPKTKDNRIVAIGRWDDPQKHASLLAATIARYLDATRLSLATGEDGRTEVVLFGLGAETWFAPLARRYPTVRIAGVQPQETVARTLAGARAIIFSSRWEGSPHAALEALALGATLIGPPIPSLESWTGDGHYGTISRSHRPASLARAWHQEMAAWEAGDRNPGEISRHWRKRLAPEAICQRMLDTLPPPPDAEPSVRRLDQPHRSSSPSSNSD